MANKLRKIDPNDVNGTGLGSNIFVPYEDLTISVELTTEKKGRTVFSSAGSVSSVPPVTVRFIEGENLGGSKVLTTKFTELTTRFDEDNSSENLGITAIDVDFNSSFAPLITINFVDLRGSAIFQNENSITTNQNKYSVFFQLPYSLYKLKIKGYYGKPVEYCLHMTKFTSKFNSKSGNFEITASFIGYTYAMLSDMLIGYLKAIPYTKLGGEKYKQLKLEDPNLLNLDELYDLISKINSEVGKILGDSEEYSQTQISEEKISTINDIESQLNIFSKSQGLDINSNKTDNSFIITTQNIDVNVTSYSTYKESVINYVNKFNKDNSEYTSLNSDTFTKLTIYNDLSKNKLNNPTANSLDTTLAKDILDYLTKNNYSLADDANFNVVDLRPLYKNLSNTKTNVEATNDALKKALAETLRDNIKSKIGFDPSIRSTIKNFTAAAEVFMSCIYNVSNSALNSTTRKDELTKAFKENINISDIPLSVTKPENQETTPIYYPWPDYRDGNDINGYTEAYLGKPNVLTNPNNVDEIVFIDDLFRAFIKQAEVQNDIDLLSAAEQTNWIPSSPLDTRAFTDETSDLLPPYKRIEAYTTENDLLTLVLIRAFTFLGITNNQDTLSTEEIETMAKAEAQAIKEYVNGQGGELIKQALSQYKIEKIKEVKSNVTTGGVTTPTFVIEGSTTPDYKYNYILSSKVNKYFPINQGFINGDWNSVKTNAADNGFLFLGNRSGFFDSDNPRPDDGAIYLKILTRNDYNSFIKPLPTTFNYDSSIKKISLSELEQEKITDFKSAGFDAFSGPYGVQEFSQLNWGTPKTNLLGELPLRYLFYSNIDSGLASGNGLAKDRSIEFGPLVLNEFSFYVKGQDTTNTKYLVNITNVSYYFSTIGENKGSYYVKQYSDYGETLNLIEEDITNINYPYINFTVDTYNYLERRKIPVSLFGSRFYYGQKTDEAKAFLFLHTLPWNRLNYDAPKAGIRTIFNSTNDYPNSILNLFKYRAGFISVPKLWAAFIGGLLWRYTESVDPVTFVNGMIGLIPGLKDITDLSEYPQKNEYLSYTQDADISTITIDEYSMSFGVDTTFSTKKYGKYKPLDNALKNLPKQAKDEFITIFKQFVEKDWNSLKNILELKNDVEPFNSETWSSTYNSISTLGTNSPLSKDNNGNYYLESNIMLQKYGSNFNNYIVVNPLSVDDNSPEFKYNFLLEIKPSSPVKNVLIPLLREELIIANMSYKPWVTIDLNTDNKNFSDIIIKKEIGEKYLGTFFSEFLDYTPALTEQQIKLNIFGTSDDNLIKFMLYRTCKNIYDKWVSNSEDDDVFFQCGGRGATDKALAVKRESSGPPRLIDSFRFLSRSFEDIGDDFAVNPFPIHDVMRNAPNTSLYDMITSILSSNNFDFVPLPTFINYNNPEDVKSVFTTYPTYEDFKFTGTGPSFVCVYVGQKSKHLDFGVSNNNYTNDGFDFNGVIPRDFTKESAEYEDPVVYFDVSFGQQNQNIFKDIELDQNEFSETAESLQIMDDISTKGAETNRSLAGQNIYNVYAVRSYKVEVEMMGDAMIQPMMYFQLKNIPMFHGAYMITRVKHSIRPNYMSTNFTGVRIRGPLTPIFTAGDLFASLIDTINSANVTPRTSTTAFGSGTLRLPPVVNTLYETGSSNADDSNQSKEGNKVIPVGELPIGISYSNLEERKRKLIPQAIPALKRMLTDWVSWMKTNTPNIADTKGTYATITSMYRTYQDQKSLYEEYKAKGKEKQVAQPGTSPHGWGFAVDLQFQTDGAAKIANDSDNLAEGFDYSKNVSLKWLAENGYKYGWIIPSELRDGSKLDEFWHFEYHGTATKCLLEKNPIYRGPKGTSDGITVKPTENYIGGIVKNPIASDGKEAVYSSNDCNYKVIKRGDGTNKEGSVPSKEPNLKCGKASANDVNSVYPRTKLYRNGPADVIVVQTNGPTVSVKKSDFPLVKYQRTIFTAQEYISAAESIIDKLAPNATKSQKKLILVSAFAISKSEQGYRDGFKGFNNNISGVESDGFKVFNKSDVNGYVVANEGNTDKTKEYFSFSTLSAGLVPLISSIMTRNLFDTGGGVNEWAWRYFRDWNGYGARTTKKYQNDSNYNDCNIISNNEIKYNNALSVVSKYTKYT